MDDKRLISPTRMRTFRRCRRRWWWRYVHGVEVPRDSRAELGTEFHRAIAHYLRTGKIGHGLSQDVQQLLSVALPMQPIPPVPINRVERDIQLQVGPVEVEGTIDLLAPDRIPDYALVIDHKTSSGNPAWIKGEYELITDPQAVIYGSWASQHAHELGIGSRGCSVRFALDYYWTAGQRGHKRVSTILGPDVLRVELGRLGQLAELMLETAELTEPGQVDGNPGACRDFGGCPLISLCREHGIFPGGVQVTDVLEEYRRKKAARLAEQGTPIAPPTDPEQESAERVARLRERAAAGGPKADPQPDRYTIEWYGLGEAGSTPELPVRGEVRIEIQPGGSEERDRMYGVPGLYEAFETSVAAASLARTLTASWLKSETDRANKRVTESGGTLQAISFLLGEGAIIRYLPTALPAGSQINPPDGPSPSKAEVPASGPGSEPAPAPVPKLPDGTEVAKASAKQICTWLAEICEVEEKDVLARVRDMSGGRLLVEHPRRIGGIVALLEPAAAQREACHALGLPLPEDRGMTKEPSPSNVGKGEQASQVQVPAPPQASQPQAPGLVLLIDCAPLDGPSVSVETLLSSYYRAVAEELGASYYGAPSYREGQRRVLELFLEDYRAGKLQLGGFLILDSKSAIYTDAVGVLQGLASATIRGF